MRLQSALTAAFVLTLGTSASAQLSGFRTPGMPNTGITNSPTGQSDRFSSQFNPALAFIVDAIGSYTDIDNGDDGLDIQMRTLEFTGQAHVDPNAWAYFVIVGTEEEIGVEEAAINYTGLPGNSSLRAGRFFVDFGKQMQTHIHDLRTIDRPLPLREYLGEELGGDGLQWDHWTTAGDAGAVRWSIGAFGSALNGEGHGHGEEEGGEEGAEAVFADLKDVDELNFTARLTGFMDVGENGTLQLGGSMRTLPDFAFVDEASGSSVEGLSNNVFGLDATYGWTSPSGLRRWTAGLEFMVNDGDLEGEIDDGGTPGDPTDDTIEVIDDSLSGFYVFADYAWNQFNSVGVQFADAELLEDDEATEVDIYYTRMFSEFHRLRFSVTQTDFDLADDSFRFAVQYTAFLGAHAHGINF